MDFLYRPFFYSTLLQWNAAGFLMVALGFLRDYRNVRIFAVEVRFVVWVMTELYKVTMLCIIASWVFVDGTAYMPSFPALGVLGAVSLISYQDMRHITDHQEGDKSQRIPT